MGMDIRPLTHDDYDQWLPLWQENCEHKITDIVTAETWRRLTDPAAQVFGLCARGADGTIAAILHYILHPTTGQIAPVCYMQDLFVTPAFRRQGAAKTLIGALHAAAKSQGWARIYWIAANDNPAAVNLYKSLGIRLDFGFYVLPIQN